MEPSVSSNVSTQYTQPHASKTAVSELQASTDPEPILREILAAITTCNASVADRTGEVKGMKVENPLVRQKLRERAAALEGRLSTLEDEWQPLQRDVKYVCFYGSANVARPK